jgi:hypothetical protein
MATSEKPFDVVTALRVFDAEGYPNSAVRISQDVAL